MVSLSKYLGVKILHTRHTESIALLQKLRKLSCLSSLMKIVLATKAVSLHWPVLPRRWRSVESVEVRMLGLSQETRNLHRFP